MAAHKNHHYIPQFYLRNFAVDPGKKRIARFNYWNGFFTDKATIKNQACEKNLYGNDPEIELALGKLENLTAIIFDKIIKSNTPPPAKSVYYRILKEFILYQQSRTKKSGKKLNDATSLLMTEIFKHSEIYKEEYKDIRFYYEQPALRSLMLSAYSLPMLDFLSCKLIVNNTTVPFITSDHPVVKYNQFMEIKKRTQATTGLAIKGLQLFFPLSPRLLLVFFDEFVYKLDTRNTETISITEAIDVHELNALQIINCNECIYCGNNIDLTYLKQLREKYKALKEKAVQFSHMQKPELGSNHGLLINSEYNAQLNLNLSFIKLTKKAKQYQLGNSMLHLRHPSLLQKTEEIRVKTSQLFDN